MTILQVFKELKSCDAHCRILRRSEGVAPTHGCDGGPSPGPCGVVDEGSFLDALFAHGGRKLIVQSGGFLLSTIGLIFSLGGPQLKGR